MSDSPAAGVVSGNIVYGIISLYECKVFDDWKIYQEQLKQYFVANMITIERKVSILFTIISPQPYIILRNLCDPQRPIENLQSCLLR